MLRSNLYDYSDAHVIVKWEIYVLAVGANENDKTEKYFAFKVDVSFKSCITKINGTLIDIAKDCNIAIPMCNMLEYIQSYSISSGILWNCYRHELPDINDNISDGKSFKCKTKIVGKQQKYKHDLAL